MSVLGLPGQAWHCPWCHIQQTGASELTANGHPGPSVGDVTFCVWCYGVSVLVSGDGVQRRATDADLAELGPEGRETIAYAIRKLKQADGARLES